jgi:hypothetical protein
LLANNQIDWGPKLRFRAEAWKEEPTMSEPQVDDDNHPIPIPPSLSTGKLICSHLLKILGGAIASAGFSGIVFWLFIPKDRTDGFLLLIAMMGFMGAALVSTMTTRVVCYSMFAGIIFGALLGFPDGIPKQHESFVALGTMTIGMLTGLLFGCCWTIYSRSKPEKYA